MGLHLAPSSPGRHPLNQTVTEKGEIPDLNNPRVPVDPDLGSVLEVGHELAQDFRVRGPVQ